jgi:hypothetical protein
VVLERLRQARDRQDTIEGQIAGLEASAPRVPRDIEQRLRVRLADWRELLRRDIQSGREVLKTLLIGPLRFRPIVEPQRRAYAFEGAVALDRVLTGLIELPTLTVVASPGGHAAGWSVQLYGISDLKVA